ncbi:hypothetical protein SDC9_136241 [bioreactor metagenome]|uniref:Uncharacterized protein n=1 Tax=bioreactor metagenome TaxID=1076179 RepID=A0A645DJY2_9ZZZZ
MEVHGRILPVFQIEQLFRIGLWIALPLGEVAVSNGHERESHLEKITYAVVGDIPAEHIVANLVELAALLRPVLGRPVAKRGQHEALLFRKRLHATDCGVDFGAFHNG